MRGPGAFCRHLMSRWLACTIAVVAVVAFFTIIKLSGSVMAATVNPPETPQAWADQLVALFASPAHTAGEGRAWDTWYNSLYDPEFSKLMADNQAFASQHQSIGMLDHDPLCACQGGSVRFRVSSVDLRPDGLAEVKAASCYPPEVVPAKCGDVDLILKRIDSAWKLYDVIEHGYLHGSVRDILVHDNECYRNDDSAQCHLRPFR